jgi:two-component system sensor histidine kinase QseC
MATVSLPPPEGPDGSRGLAAPPVAGAAPDGGYSLRRRLVIGATVAACAVWGVLGFTMQRTVLSTSAREFDERLELQANAVMTYAEHEFAETGQPAASADAARDLIGDTRREVVYQVWTDDARPVHLSLDAPDTPVLAIGQTGFFDVMRGAEPWRVYAEHSRALPLIVQVAEPLDHRGVIADRALRSLLVPLSIALPAFAALLWWLTSRLFRPVDRLAASLDRRETFDPEPLDVARMPRETAALGRAVNSLVLRQAAEVARQQRFTSDAAHELRTPLAAVRAQAQVALRAPTPEETRHALRRLIEGVDRTTRLVAQLLSLARLETAGRPGSATPLGAVLSVVLHDLAEAARVRDVRLELGYGDERVAALPVREEPVYLLVRNLVDNAIRHSPAGGPVDIAAASRDGWLRLTVADRGPGIPAELRSAAFEPFRRFSNDPAGSGLGLAIVRRVVDVLGGRIELADRDGGGLEARVSLPLEPGDRRAG